MTHKLFVYGTLRQGARDRLGRAARKRLSQAGIWRGTASFRGALYDLGAYPGLVETDSSVPVSGEIIDLHAPQDVFSWLDAYEGIDPLAPETSEYKRVTRTITGATGMLTAWVYLYRLPPSGAKRIESGNWLKHAAAKQL